MIVELDHAVVVLRDIEAGIAAYQTLFARAPAWRAEADGVATALFTFDNTTLELMAPMGALEPMLVPVHEMPTGNEARMANHRIRKLVVGDRQVPRWRRQHGRLVAERHELPGQRIDDHFLASQKGKRSIGIHADAHGKDPPPEPHALRVMAMSDAARTGLPTTVRKNWPRNGPEFLYRETLPIT